MTFGQIRFIKWSLFLLLIGSTSYVSHAVWEGFSSRAPANVEIEEPSDPVSRLVEIEQLDDDGNVAWTLRASESIARTEESQLFRDVEIRFDAGRDGSPVFVTAEHCEIRKDSSVYFEGDVIVRDVEDMRLEARTLEFRRFPDRVWSTEPVRFFREGVSGTAGNMLYTIRRGHLELGDDVDMTFREKGNAPVRVRSKRATMQRERHFVQYVDRVRVREQGRSLSCNDLRIFLAENNQDFERVVANEKVDMWMNVPPDEEPRGDDEEIAETGGDEDDTVLPTSLAFQSEPGSKRLLTERLEVFYRPGGEKLDRIRAIRNSRLMMKAPQGAEDGVNKELDAHLLAFNFDEEGALIEVRGRGGVTMTLSPASQAGGDEAKVVRARQMESDFDPETGELVEARGSHGVEFEQGDVHGTAEEGTFDAVASLLKLYQSPKLWDSRASLEASQIEIQLDKGGVTGIGDVKSSTRQEGKETSLFPTSEEAPVHFVADRLEYDRESDVAVYTGSARGFQGSNRIEAETIRIYQGSGDLDAEGGVRTVFLQELATTGDEQSKPAPTVTESASFRFRSEEDVLEYRDEVEMRSKELSLRGQKLDVKLAKEGGGVEHIAAEGEVAIQTPDGEAAGETARYLPKEQSMTVTGERAWLSNAGKVTEGKQLTFFLTDDRILVDGREQTRTKTTYSSKPRPF